MPDRLRALASIDDDLKIAETERAKPTRHQMWPVPPVNMIQLADIGRDDVVLEVERETGYVSALLPLPAGSVVTLGCDDRLVEKAIGILNEDLPRGLFRQLHNAARPTVAEDHGNPGKANVCVREVNDPSARRGFNISGEPLPDFEKAKAFGF